MVLTGGPFFSKLPEDLGGRGELDVRVYVCPVGGPGMEPPDPLDIVTFWQEGCNRESR